MAAQARALESQVWRERDEEQDDDKASTADDRRAQEEEMSILVSIFCDCARGDDANAVREALASGRDVGDATSSGRLFRAELEIDVEIELEVDVEFDVEFGPESALKAELSSSSSSPSLSS